MQHQIALSTLILLLPIFRPITSECIDDDRPKTRFFDSIIAYQGNRVPFDPRKAAFDGNYVAFTNRSIETLFRNTFISFDSDYIRKLSLDDHEILQIEDGAFLSLICLSDLNLKKNRIFALSMDLFDGLSHLTKLDLGENQIVEIPDFTFNRTRRLEELNMTRNRIKVIHSNSFYKLYSLKKLDLSYNYLRKIVPSAFQYLTHLNNLQIGSNQIESLDLNKWTNLNKLNILNVSNNVLTSVDLSYSFSFAGSLTEIYLDENYLITLNPEGLRRHLPALTSIGLNKNPWHCRDLVSIVRKLNDSRIKYWGTTVVEPHVGGIACNRTIQEYQSYKWTEPPTEEEAPILTTRAPKTNTENALFDDYVAPKVLDAVNSLRIIISCLFAIVLLYVFVDVAIRTGCLRGLNRATRGNLNDSDEVEDVALLRSRV